MNTPSTHQHWDNRYSSVGTEQVSWYEQRPTTSIKLLDRLEVPPSDSVIDIGGGASHFVDELLDRGHTDITVLDLSAGALATSRQRNAEHGQTVHWKVDDIRDWTPPRQWDLWHDRAAFHFLAEPEERHHYLEAVANGLSVNGLIIIGAFAPEGPTHCSGLPVQRYDAVHLYAELTKHTPFDLVAAEHHDHATPDGDTQPFTWIVARRRIRSVCC